MKDIIIKFVGIDSWNRPVFKQIGKNVFFGDVNKLWVFKELGENNKNLYKYYENNPKTLELFGSEFDCEPHGGNSDKWNFIFVKKGDETYITMEEAKDAVDYIMETKNEECTIFPMEGGKFLVTRNFK